MGLENKNVCVHSVLENIWSVDLWAYSCLLWTDIYCVPVVQGTMFYVGDAGEYILV